MRAVVVVGPLVAFAVTLMLHVLWWRWSRPRADAAALLFLMLVLPALGYLGFLVLPPPGWTLAKDETCAMALLHLALGAAYVQTYPACQAASPSLRMALAVGRAPQGLTHDEIVTALGGDNRLGARLEDLTDNALLRRNGETFVLTTAGRALARLFRAYRALLGLKAAGG